jgi:ATP-dependent protease ClpP protease subunit
MESVININGEIGVYAQTSLLSVVEQMKKTPDITSVKVIINSEGGEVETGFQIYDYLKSLNIPVTTVADGMCCSIATVIFMAGSKRIVKDSSVFMIHLPWGQTMGTAEEIALYDRLKNLWIERDARKEEIEEKEWTDMKSRMKS